MKAQSGKTGKGAGMQSSTLKKTMSVVSSKYKSAKASDSRKRQIRATGAKRGK